MRISYMQIMNNLMQTGLTVSLAALVPLLLRRMLKKRYPARAVCLVWALLAKGFPGSRHRSLFRTEKRACGSCAKRAAQSTARARRHAPSGLLHQACAPHQSRPRRRERGEAPAAACRSL